MLILVPMAFFAPFTGILSFIWMAYTRPQEWAYAGSAQYSLAIAAATIAGYLLFELPQRPPRLKEHFLLLLLILQYTVAGWLLAYSPEYAQLKYTEMMKIFLITILISSMTDSESRVRWILLVSLGTIGGISFRSFLGIIITGGSRVYGPGGLYEDNNDYAILLNLALPMLFYFGQKEKQRWLRYTFYLFSFTSLITILFTYSRGGFIGLCLALIFMALKSRYKITGLIGVAVLGVVFFSFAPKEVLNRVNTIQGASENDSSAQQRLRAWAVCLKIAADRPFTGVGVRNILLVYGRYGDPLDTRVAHNSYLQIVADCGIPGLALFLLLLFVTYRRLSKSRKILMKYDPNSKLISYAHGMQVGMIGYMSSAFFASKEDVELIYTVFALGVSCIVIARETQKQGKINELVTSKNYSLKPPTLVPVN